ncbi:MAG: hypothetical protein HUU16_15455, partial [Candidatus Omnitrophica bacterium]|nr:hypothetical protein [Candidatus Omnitrophota bacterium]
MLLFQGRLVICLSAMLTLVVSAARLEAKEVMPPDDDPAWLEAQPDAPGFGGPIPPPVGGALWSEKGVNQGAISQGPGPLKNGQTENCPPNNAVCGAVHVVRPHPTNANILYIAAANGGVWRSDNATAASPNWVPLTDQLPTLSMSALEFDPTDATFNTLIGGTGRTSAYLGTGGARIGVIRTTDGGANWTVLDGGLAGLNISGVAARGNTILVSVNNSNTNNTGIYRSIDGGQMFTRISGMAGSNLPLAGRAFDLFVDPVNGMTAYTGISQAGAQNGIYQSTNFGQTWNRVSSPAMNGLISDANTNNIEIAVGNSNNVFVGIINNGRLAGFFNSPNGGGNWNQMDQVVTNENTGAIGLQPREKPGGQGGIHFSIVADPNNPNIVYVGGDRQPHANEGMSPTTWPNSIGATDFSGRLFRGNAAAAAGTQWAHLTHSNALGAAGGGTANSSSPHADSREMAFDANGNIIEGDDGGVFRRTNPQNNTGDWFSIVGDLRVTEVHDIAYDTIADVLLTGHQDNGTGLQDSPGNPSWTAVRVADGGDVKIDTLTVPNGSIRYWSSQSLGGFGYQAFDNNNAPLGGRTVAGLTVSATGAALVARFLTPVELNRFIPTRLLIIADNSIYESFDQGNNLFEVGPGLGPNLLPNANAVENAVVYGGRRNGVDNPGVFYVGSLQQVIVRTVQGGPVGPTAAPFPGGSNVLDIVVNPEDWMEAYVIDADQVYFTPDAGATWQDITGNLTGVGVLRSLEYVPRAGFDVVVVGTDIGVFRTRTNDLGTWNEIGTNLPNTLAYDLQYDPVDDVLAVGTMGRGAWLVTLPCETGITISGPDIVTVCDDAAAVAIEGFAGSCEDDPIVGVEWRLVNAPVGSPFAVFTNTGVATAPDSGVLVHYTIDLEAPGGARLPNNSNVIEVRAITAGDEVTDVRQKEIRVIEVTPMVTIESPSRVTVCDDVEDVELHGFAATCDADPIERVEFRNVTANPAGPFLTAGVSLATPREAFTNYVINLGPPGAGGNLPFIFPATNGRNRIEVRAVTVDGDISAIRFVEIEVLSVQPMVTLEAPSPLEVCITDPDVQLQGFVQSCPADPINVVEFSINGGAFAPVDQVATIREGFDSWVLRLGAPDGARLPVNNTEVRIRATTVDGDLSDVVSTFVRWPRLALQDLNLDLAGEVGAGNGVQPHLLGSFVVAEVDGFVQSGPIHLALQNILLPADGSTPTIGHENIAILPAEFELTPGQTQVVTVQVQIPVNTSFGTPINGTNPPLPTLLHGPTTIRVRGECTNPLNAPLQVTVSPYRDDDLLRRGFPHFCGDCAPSHWQMFSFPVVGLDRPFNPTLFGSTLRNQLEDDFGLINVSTTPFHAVRWDPARTQNVSFARYNPPNPLLEPTTIINPGEAFSMVRRIPGDITLDGYFLNHAPNQPAANYPRVAFPSLGTVWEGSYDQSRPLNTPLTFPTAIQIGNPYAFSIRVYEQAVEDPGTGLPTSSLTAIPVPDVVRSVRRFNRWVGEQFLEIQGDPEIPVLFSPWNGTLRPTEGCFVQYGLAASRDTRFVFNRPPLVNDSTPWPQIFDFTNKSGDKEAADEVPQDLQEIPDKVDPEGWGYRLTLTSAEGEVRTLVVGAYPGASAGLDGADVESIFPPWARPSDLEFDFYVNRAGWGATGILLRDMCSPSDVRAGVRIPLTVLSTSAG